MKPLPIRPQIFAIYNITIPGTVIARNLCGNEVNELVISISQISKLLKPPLLVIKEMGIENDFIVNLLSVSQITNNKSYGRNVEKKYCY